jgi:hypothetical protein
LQQRRITNWATATCRSEKFVFWDVPSAAWQPINEVHEIKEQIKTRVQDLAAH